MDLETYQEFTGLTVEDEDKAKVTAQIRRTRIALESMLGYSLQKKKAGLNQYSEKGKAKVECDLRGIIWGGESLASLDLDPADEVQGSYRLYPYNSSDIYLKTDPFTKLYKVKLVFVSSGDEPNGITHRTFGAHQLNVQKKNGIAKYIERCNECVCQCRCDDCMQLAVEADWLNEECLPDELLQVWADMVEYYSDEDRGLVSESLGTHSYKFESPDAPESLDQNIAIIKRYAGPNGSMTRTPV